MNTWIDEYKRLISVYKLEEKNLIHSTDDFHLKKIITSLFHDEVEIEKRNFESTINHLKNSIYDINSNLKGLSKIKNFELWQKIQKIDEIITNNRWEYKTKFENLLNEEEALEREIKEYEVMIQNNNFYENRDNMSNTDTQTQDNFQNLEKNYQHNDKIDEFISYTLNNIHIFDDFSIESVSKYINKLVYKDLSYIKDKIKTIDQIIDKSLGGINLTWQTRDHQEFIKLKASFANKINSLEFLNALEDILPFIPRSELKNHIKLCNKYNHMTELKKMLISQYKIIKDIQEENDKKDVLDKITHNNTNNIVMQIPKKNKEILEEWKKRKLLEKKEKYEEQLKIQEELKEKEKMKFATRASTTKSLIENYKKSSDQTILDQSSKNCAKFSINQIDLDRIKEKNEKLIHKKTLIIKSKSLNFIKKASNYTKYKLKKMAELEKIPLKIHETTEIHENKKRNKYNFQNDPKKDAFTMANNVLGRMSRAVPAWRQSLI